MPQPLGSQRVRHSLVTAQKQTLPRLEVFFSLGTACVCHTTNPSVGPGGQKKMDAPILYLNNFIYRDLFKI